VRRSHKKKAATAAQTLTETVDETLAIVTSSPDERPDQTARSDESGLSHAEQIDLVHQAIRGRWLTGSTTQDIANLDLKQARARDVAIASILDTMAHGDPSQRLTAIGLMTRMEAQNQRDQHLELVTLTGGSMPDLQPAATINVAVQVGELRQEVLEAHDWIEREREKAIAADGDSRTVREVGESRPVENGPPPGDDRSSSNGHRNGKK